MHKKIALALGAAWIACAGMQAQAQEAWPTKPLRLVASFPAGTGGDLIARALQPALQKAFGQPVIVDNKPGASGNIGVQEVARATDGHTVLVGPDTMFTINPYLYRKSTFNPMTDLVPVTQMATTVQMLVCNPATGIKTLDDMMAAAKRAPMSYASGGPGVPGHMAMEMLLAATHAPMQHVPYRGPGPAMQDVLGGMVPCGFLASPVVGPMVRNGKLVGIATSGAARLKSFPAIPTVAESGIKGYDATFTEMMAMPKGTPPAVVHKLQAAVAAAIASPDVQARLSTMDLEPLANTPEEAARRIAAENKRWGEVAGRLGLQLD